MKPMRLALALSLALAGLLAVPRPWAARAVQAGLALAALEWLRTAALLVARRQATGAPYTRLALILGAVAAVTALSLLAFRSARLRRRYRLEPFEPSAA